MVATVATVAYLGLEARAVEVQVQLAAGLPRFIIVGLPDKAVAESRERVRAALAAIGLALPPKRITVNLSPADLPKEGSHFDLPIALGVLAAIGADRRRGAVALCRGRRTGARRADRRVAGRAARGAARVGAATGADLPGGAGRARRPGRRGRGDRGARPAGAARPLQGDAVLPPPEPGEPSSTAAGPDLARSRARRAPSARWRSPRRGGTTC